uniref:Uncharacterized protein n=1 Tax=Florenciella sp. virus SA2 TaxID=3240092 RepID=A0AB39JEN4_9VIRU
MKLIYNKNTYTKNKIKKIHKIIGNYLDSSDQSFNRNPYVRESHNCYMYFLNKKNNEVVELCKKDYKYHKICRRAQPGYISGFKQLTKSDYNCPTMLKRTLSDNKLIYNVSEKGTCKDDFYKGALVVAPKRDYHYYRYNDDDIWTHKPGYKPSTMFDSNNNFITNPRLAARDYGGTLNYKDFCGYLCVPREDKLKIMSHRPNNENNKNQAGGSARKFKKIKNAKLKNAKLKVQRK